MPEAKDCGRITLHHQGDGRRESDAPQALCFSPRFGTGATWALGKTAQDNARSALLYSVLLQMRHGPPVWRYLRLMQIKVHMIQCARSMATKARNWQAARETTVKTKGTGYDRKLKNTSEAAKAGPRQKPVTIT